MIIGLFWDRMTSGVQAQVIRDLLACADFTDGVYWTGLELDAALRVLGVNRCTDIDKVQVWRTYQVEDQPVVAPTPVDTIPCVLHQDATNVQMRVSKKKRIQPDQGYINTFNPYDLPMPDPNSRCVDPRVMLIWT